MNEPVGVRPQNQGPGMAGSKVVSTSWPINSEAKSIGMFSSSRMRTGWQRLARRWNLAEDSLDVWNQRSQELQLVAAGYENEETYPEVGHVLLVAQTLVSRDEDIEPA